ncbi:10229_t:CDS:2 [Diversispora eburnea]|uniref:10229_t:CDS:1 n=1 Tax=Diversispora eburnea TaxID=1213867 RepID=A0A9N8V7B5_9GLOM|nr:10229_t:CDS:2 [Diversispora eburnea]
MELPITCSAPLSSPPPFPDDLGGVTHSNVLFDERIPQRIHENSNNVNENPENENGYNCDEEAPAYSYYPSTEGSPFELKTIGKSPLNIKEKYLCGDLLDNRYFLLEFVRFKQIKVFKVPRYSALVTLAGKNNHVRIYDLKSIRLSMDSIFDDHELSNSSAPSLSLNNLNLNLSLNNSSFTNLPLSLPPTTINNDATITNPSRNTINFSESRNFRNGPTRSFIAVLSRQNIFLFELDFGEVNRSPEFILTRTYWLPQTPKFLKMSMHEDQLLNIIAVFDNDVILVGVEDARIRDVLLDPNLRPDNSHTFRSLSSLICDSPSWRTFSQLPWVPNFDPEFLSDSFTIPPPYSLISMIVDEKGRPFCTIIYKWSLPPVHVEFIKPKDKKHGEGFVVGFGKNMVEVRSLNTGRLVENVVRGVDVQFLGRGEGEEMIWGCHLSTEVY